MPKHPFIVLRKYYVFEIRLTKQVVKNVGLVSVVKEYVSDVKTRCLGALTLYQMLDTELVHHTLAKHHYDNTIKQLDKICEKNKNWG